MRLWPTRDNEKQRRHPRESESIVGTEYDGLAKFTLQVQHLV